eukprot:5947350-Amphidinium_carterae.1
MLRDSAEGAVHEDAELAHLHTKLVAELRPQSLQVYLSHQWSEVVEGGSEGDDASPSRFSRSFGLQAEDLVKLCEGVGATDA